MSKLSKNISDQLFYCRCHSHSLPNDVIPNPIPSSFTVHRTQHSPLPKIFFIECLF
ncbi:hypothetical protein MTR_5g075110 [Medicago truncatula]|uniref:Uncharacterized protein n=1 Tax=Medicago truncatula TaxID=3880 RepID=G7K0R2_MEDTR|nr:hypothetical protein MTR_5g075110 [Medicago truncatula]